MMMVKADSFQTTSYSIMESGLHESRGPSVYVQNSSASIQTLQFCQVTYVACKKIINKSNVNHDLTKTWGNHSAFI